MKSSNLLVLLLLFFFGGTLHAQTVDEQKNRLHQSRKAISISMARLRLRQNRMQETWLKKY